MKLLQNDRSVAFTDLLPLIMVLLCTVIVSVTCTAPRYNYDNTLCELTKGWKMADGTTVSIDDLPVGDVSLTHDLSGIDLDRKRLCFFTTHTNVISSFDGVENYEYAPQLAPILGRSYGRYIHLIPIPPDAKSVTLTLHPLYDNSAVVVTDIAVEDAGMFMADIYHDGLPNFALCMLISLFGVLMLIMGLTTLRSFEKNAINFFSLGAFAILIGIWSANDTMILQVFTQHPEIVRFVNYLSLIFLSYLPVSFIASATNHRDTVLLPIMLVLVLANFAATMTLSLLSIKDIREMLLFSHINVAAAMCMVVYLMIRSVRKRTAATDFLRNVIAGMTSAVIGVGIDLVRYQLFPNSPLGASFFTRIAVLIFIVLMGIYLVRERTRFAVEKGQAELMKKMAYTDGLTELGNRAAFHKRESEIRNERAECVIVQLDINFLKKVNDVYGHAEGDRQIISASKIIKKTFEHIGDSFRTGGDEFIVITRRGGIADVEKALEKMEKRVSEYNESEKPPVPLQIAYGYAHCSMKTDMLEEAERLADQRMYKKKNEMKLPK